VRPSEVGTHLLTNLNRLERQWDAPVPPNPSPGIDDDRGCGEHRAMMNAQERGPDARLLAAGTAIAPGSNPVPTSLQVFASRSLVPAI
jgi:hypothetical protein